MIVLLLQEFRAGWRSFRYPAFLLVVLFFAILDPLMLKYMNEIVAYFAIGIEMVIPEPTAADAFASYLGDVSQIGIFVLIFMSMGLVAREKETGVTGWLLSKPISRFQYLTAKLLALYTVIISGLIICSLFAYLYTGSLIEYLPFLPALQATACLIVFTLLIGTFNFTFSTLLKTPLQAGGLTIGIFFLSGIINMLISGSKAADYYPNSLLAMIPRLLAGTADASIIVRPMLVSLVIIAALLALTVNRFIRLEL